MLLGGDEIGRTQLGNNNGYCQDNELSYFDWERRDDGLLMFTERALQLRREHPVFRRRRWFQGRDIHGEQLLDIAWFKPDGGQMTGDDWSNGYAKSLAVFLNGDQISAPDPRGQHVFDDSFFLMFNAHHEPIDFLLPRGEFGARWIRILDTVESLPRFYRAGQKVPVADRSLCLLRRVE